MSKYLQAARQQPVTMMQFKLHDNCQIQLKQVTEVNAGGHDYKMGVCNKICHFAGVATSDTKKVQNPTTTSRWPLQHVQIQVSHSVLLTCRAQDPSPWCEC